MFENIMIALGEKRVHIRLNKSHSAMKYLLPKKAGKISEIDIPQEIYENPDITEIELSAKIGDIVSPPPHSFDFLGYICTKGETKEEANKNLQKASKDIKIVIE